MEIILAVDHRRIVDNQRFALLRMHTVHVVSGTIQSLKIHDSIYL